MKWIAVYSNHLALQCGLMGYTIDTINGRHDFSCLSFLRLQGNLPRLALLCGLWQSENIADIRQEREFTVSDNIFLLLPKCHKWLCYAVC